VEARGLDSCRSNARNRSASGSEKERGRERARKRERNVKLSDEKLAPGFFSNKREHPSDETPIEKKE